MKILALVAALAALASGQTVRIGVFGLFRPHSVSIRAAPGSAAVARVGSEEMRLEGARALRLRARADGVLAHVDARGGELIAAVPGKIERRFAGNLEVTSRDGVLVVVVIMDRETAVASAVAAESAPGALIEALKAQAVVARSFYAASRGRHKEFDFCDTTHCQFLRERPAAESDAARAAIETRGLILAFRGSPIEALFTASCGGRTRALDKPGPDGYPYFEVECPYCRAGNTVACSYCVREAGAWPNRRGDGKGHGAGLCQNGAAALARGGSRFEQILSRYFPGAAIASRGEEPSRDRRPTRDAPGDSSQATPPQPAAAARR